MQKRVETVAANNKSQRPLVSAKASGVLVRQALVVVGTTIAVMLLLLLLWQAAEVLLFAFAGVLLAVLLRGMSDWVSKRMRLSEGLSLAGVVITLTAISCCATWLLAPKLVGQFDRLSLSLAAAVQQVEGYLREYEWGLQVLTYLPTGEELVPNLSDVLGVFSTTLVGLAGVVMILFIGVYVAAEPRLYTQGMIRLVPLHKRGRVHEVFREVGHTLRWWMIGRLISMTIVGVLTAVAMWLIGVPVALTLGLLVGLMTFVPYLGPILGTVPVVLLALLQSPTKAAYVLFVYLAIQSLEGYLLTPLVQQKTVSLPPALTLTAQVLLGVLIGTGGIVIATPLTAVAIVLVRMFYVEDLLGDWQGPAVRTARNENLHSSVETGESSKTANG